MLNLVENKVKFRSLRKRLALYLAKKVQVETTAEGKSIARARYKKWARRLRV